MDRLRDGLFEVPETDRQGRRGPEGPYVWNADTEREE